MSTAASDKLRHGFPIPGPQSLSGAGVMEQLFFLSDEEWKAARETVRYDHVVVGSGICALAFVQRIHEKNPNAKILVLERGPFFLPEHIQNLPLPCQGALSWASETFPWTLCNHTVAGTEEQQRYIHWQHGMVPFFGGRSTLWSGWCQRPTKDEMDGWPVETINAAMQNFDAAEKLLHVRCVDVLDLGRDEKERNAVTKSRPVYGELQKFMQSLLAERIGTVPGVYSAQAASLACDARSADGIDFQKFAAPGEWLALAGVRDRAAGSAGCIDIVINCAVERIVQQNNMATALQTSRGMLPLGGANLVLAMGTLPPATLVRNAFPHVPSIGRRYTAHFVSAIVARMPRALLDPYEGVSQLELGACTIAGMANDSRKQPFHIQLSALSDKNPEQNGDKVLRYVPDMLVKAPQAQWLSSHVVFVCTALGALDYHNSKARFMANRQDGDPVTNSLLQVLESASDLQTWDAMDIAAFDILERVLGKGSGMVEYWTADDPSNTESGQWGSARPSAALRRLPGLVHEGSTLYIGATHDSPVDLDYKVRGTHNVYVTGGGLLPQGSAWNPTLTMVALAQDLADKLAANGNGKA